MAEIVGAFLMPHDPLVASEPNLPDPRQKAIVMDAYARIARRIRDVRADTAIIIGDDHFTLFGPACQPAYAIGIGDLDGPIEPWLGIPKTGIDTNQPLAKHIMAVGFATGFDWSVSTVLTADHSIMVPYQFAVRPNASVRVIPVYLRVGVEPLLPSRRAFELGQSIGRAVRSFPKADRVVVIGTGGISHWVGMAQMGQINEEFDRRVLDLVKSGDVNSLISISDEEILAQAGNGGWEIKNWICAMGAAPGCKGEVIAYEPVIPWVTGMGFAELHVA